MSFPLLYWGFTSAQDGHMNTGNTVFAQLLDFLPMPEFRRCVRRYQGDHYVKRFSCHTQFVALAFAQITFRESLRDIETCLAALRKKLYHCGVRGMVARNTLAHANETRDWRIYADFARELIETARDLSPSGTLRPGARRDDLHSRCNDDRSVPGSVSAGNIPAYQRSHQTPYVARSSGEYPHIHRNNARKCP